MARILWISRCRRATPAAALLVASLVHGQASATGIAPPENVEDALHQMSDHAGVIFTGQVVAVRRHDGENVASGVVEIDFRVDQAVRGCTAGTSYVLREWAGLWAGGNQRYRVGQRLLMLLHAPGPSGMSSPIGGMDGAIPIHGGNSTLVANSSTAPQYPVADLRWVAAKLLQPVSYRTEPVHPGHPIAPPIPFIVARPTAQAAVAGAQSADVPVAATSASSDLRDASIPAQQASVDAVIGMLTSWQKAQHAIR